MADNFAVSAGTGVTLAADDIGGVYTPRIKLDVGADGLTSAFTGTLASITNLAAGTVTSVANLAAGTVTRLNGGTLTALGIGTISVGTVLDIGLRHGDEFATVVTGTGTATGTVRAAVAGSAIYVTTAIISAGTATTNIGLSSGTPTSNNVLGTLTFAANGGLAAMPLNPPLRTTSGSALVWSQSGTSNVSLTISGYID